MYIYNVCHWESLFINQCLVLSFSVCNYIDNIVYL